MVSIVQPLSQVQRRNRSPQHPFNLKFKPWQIQPFFIAPVLPGESMKNLLLMNRLVSDPIKDKLMGWWAEHYFFYVKHTQLDIADDLIEMHLNGSKNMSAHHSAANLQVFHNGGINFVQKCLNSVKEWYFRDEDEPEPAAIDGLPPAKINHDGWWQSGKLESQLPADAGDDLLPGQESTYPDAAPAGFEGQFAQWELMKAAGLTQATFEDYLATFGVKVADQAKVDEQARRPELIRYSKEFAFPTNTVDPATGVPSSAVVWSISERADKTRYFKEPGFLFGVTVVRPKVLLTAITGSLTSYMTGAFSWLPAVLADLPFTSLKEFASGAGPIPTAFGEDYWIDVKDLFIHGEQFRNHDGSAQGNKVALPDTSFNDRYASNAMADALFVGAANQIRCDGIVSLNIASPQARDTTP